jgi:hypothetical protein
MCFVQDDYDWIARHTEDDTITVTADTRKGKKVHCVDCGSVIPVGVECRRMYCQEHEACKVCDLETRAEIRDESDSIEEFNEADPPPCEKCDYGETTEDFMCGECCKLRGAIREVEIAEGCSPHEAEPLIGELRDAFWESDHAIEYIDRARQEYPELALSGHLDRFYKLTNEWDEEFEKRWDTDDLEPVDELGGES